MFGAPIMGGGGGGKGGGWKKKKWSNIPAVKKILFFS